MQFIKIEVDNKLQEINKHGSSDLPIAIYTDNFSLFEEGYIRWHWHKEIQISYVISDKVCFYVEGKEIILEPGEGIIFNSNILHQIKPYKGNSMMFSIVFDSILLSASEQSLIGKKYVNPILASSKLKFITLKKDSEWQKNILNYVKETFKASNKKEYGYELEIRNYLNVIWLNLLRELKEEIDYCESIVSYDERRVKLALQYIHDHYLEDISLSNIAKSASISKSECCRSFKRILKITPFEYLMEYRVLKASEQLLNSKESISNIAFNVGFNGTSYFGRVFKKYMNCTPFEYRNKHKVKI